MNCPFCKAELVKDTDSSFVCYCGAEPRIANLTVDYYTPNYYILYFNLEDRYIGLCFDRINVMGHYQIFSSSMTSGDEGHIVSENVVDLDLDEAANILKRYAALRIFS